MIETFLAYCFIGKTSRAYDMLNSFKEVKELLKSNGIDSITNSLYRQEISSVEYKNSVIKILGIQSELLKKTMYLYGTLLNDGKKYKQITITIPFDIHMILQDLKTNNGNKSALITESLKSVFESVGSNSSDLIMWVKTRQSKEFNEKGDSNSV